MKSFSSLSQSQQQTTRVHSLKSYFLCRPSLYKYYRQEKWERERERERIESCWSMWNTWVKRRNISSSVSRINRSVNKLILLSLIIWSCIEWQTMLMTCAILHKLLWKSKPFGCSVPFCATGLNIITIFLQWSHI